ncbi:MAG: hypothetical protein O7A63_09495 [Acidobacteria bacterium]|nr:hypothetical protein [Acidobacteriota bacterium]
MNLWDVVTWIMVVVLGVSAVVIFGLFLKDIRGVLEGGEDRKEAARRSGSQGPEN